MKTSDKIDLPGIIAFESCQNDWQKYEDALYKIYLKDLFKEPPFYLGLLVKTKYHPPYKNKAFTFWHITHEGKIESVREPDFRRCERLCWIKPIINNASAFSCWFKSVLINGKQRERHFVWYSKEKFLIVLEKHKTYFFLVTAFFIEQGKRAKKYDEEYEKYVQK